MKAEEEVENEKVLKIIHWIDQMNIDDEILKYYVCYPQVQQKMTKYFSMNSGK